MKNIISIIGLLIVAASAIDDVIAIESSSKPTAIKDNQLMRRRKTKSAKSSDSSDGGGDITTISDAIPFIEDTPDDDASMSMSMSMPDGVDDPFIGLADSDASMSMPDIDSSESTEEEESVVAYGDTKDGATSDQWHAFVSTLDATHESYTPPAADADTDESVEEDESDSTPPSRADSPWHDFMSTLAATHESYTPPAADTSEEDTDGEDTSVEEEEMSMSSTASSMSMPPGDGREDNASDNGSSKARKLSTAHDTTNIHGRITKIGLTRMKTKMTDELPWGDDDSSMSMSMPIRVSEAQYTVAAAAADIEEVHSMPNSKSSKGKTWKTKSAKFGKADDHMMSMPHSKSGKAKSGKRL